MILNISMPMNCNRVQASLILWLKRKSKFGKLSGLIKIPHKAAAALGLPTRWATLKDDGTLWHESCSEPLATFSSR